MIVIEASILSADFARLGEQARETAGAWPFLWTPRRRWRKRGRAACQRSSGKVLAGRPVVSLDCVGNVETAPARRFSAALIAEPRFAG